MPRLSRANLPPLPILTLRGWVLLGAGAAAVIVAYAAGWREMLLVGITIVAAVAAAMLVVSTRPTTVQVRRRVRPGTVSAGEQARVGLEVTNQSWIPLAEQEWADVVPVDLEGDTTGRLPSLSPRGRSGSRTRLDYVVTARRRGLVTVGPLALRTTDPFGICRYDGTVGGIDELIVLPRIENLDGSLSSPAGATDSAVRAATAGRGQDDVTAREYRTGDALRHVHWRASAHRGELMVRQEQRQDEARAVVLLDNRKEMWRSTPAFEWAVAFAASVVVHLSSEVSGVELVLTAPDEASGASERRAGERGVREALLELATVHWRRAAGDDSAYLRELDRLTGDAGAPLIAVTGGMSDAEWRDVAARRGVRGAGVGVFVDPERIPTAAWAGGWRSAVVEHPATRMSDIWRSVSSGVVHG